MPCPAITCLPRHAWSPHTCVLGLDPVSRGVYREHGVAEGAAHVAQVLGRRNQIHAFFLWVRGWLAGGSWREQASMARCWTEAKRKRKGEVEDGEGERGVGRVTREMGYGFYYCNNAWAPHTWLRTHESNHSDRSVERAACCALCHINLFKASKMHTTA
jgi:hypothetical protein